VTLAVGSLRFQEMRGDPGIRGDQVTLAGKSLGDVIHVGDRFDTLQTPAGVEMPIDLRVVDIGFYGSFVLELESPMAGELFLVGESEGLPLDGATLLGTSAS